MRIVCLSDMHGHLPEVPDADLLILAGDYSPTLSGQRWWLRDKFAPWVKEISCRMKVIGIAGNHDSIWEDKRNHIPKINWTYLQDSGCKFGGLKIFGQPWQPRFCDWAFNLDEPELAKKWELIPQDTDILIVHGPPRGLCDKTDYEERIGSPSLFERLKVVKPKLVVCGHNHGGYGKTTLIHKYEMVSTDMYRIRQQTLVVNAAHVDEHYRPINPPQVIEL